MVDVDELIRDHEKDSRRAPSFPNTSFYPNFDLHEVEDVKRIDHIIEDEEGVIGVLVDGTKVRLDGYIGTITMRIRYFLEMLAGSDDINEELLIKLSELKEILSFECEEVDLAKKRMAWAEQVICERAF